MLMLLSSSLRFCDVIINFLLCGFILRLMQHIIKNPCDLRMALLTHNFKLNDDYAPSTADGEDEDVVNRFRRELLNN